MAEPDMSYTEFPCNECGEVVDIESDETVADAVIRHYQDAHDMLES